MFISLVFVARGATTFQGAIGYPLWKNGHALGKAATDPLGTSYSINIIPYAAIDRETSKKTVDGVTPTDPASVTPNRTELGVVAFLHSDTKPRACWFQPSGNHG